MPGVAKERAACTEIEREQENIHDRYVHMSNHGYMIHGIGYCSYIYNKLETYLM